MKKIIYILAIVFLLTLTGCGDNTNNLEDENSNLEELFSEENIIENNTTGSSDISREDKMEEIRKKLALKGLIAKGDMYFSEKEYTIALAQYLKVLKDIPNDKETLNKIGNIYYEQKKWSKAYDYYKRIKDYTNLDSKKSIYSLINGLYEGEANLNFINEEIDSFPISLEEKFYYKNSLVCAINFSKCRANFEEYFNSLPDDVTPLNFKDLQSIRETIINYKNFQHEDLTYKAALISGGFYKNGFYFVALKTSEEILKETPDYKPIIKIAAKSAYELGNYNLAKEYILKYNKLETNDPEASYFLGRIYERLGEKVLATVHFTKALKLGYEDQNDIRRRMIFIYYAVDENTKMISYFKELINTKDPNLTLNDYNLAIYYLIANDDLETAKEYSETAKEKFPDSELFYTYYAWIILQQENINENDLKIVDENLLKARNINSENPMVLMVSGIYFTKSGELDKALIEFKNAKKIDSAGEFTETIDYWIKEISNERKKEQKGN